MTVPRAHPTTVVGRVVASGGRSGSGSSSQRGSGGSQSRGGSSGGDRGRSGGASVLTAAPEGGSSRWASARRSRRPWRPAVVRSGRPTRPTVRSGGERSSGGGSYGRSPVARPAAVVLRTATVRVRRTGRGSGGRPAYGNGGSSGRGDRPVVRWVARRRPIGSSAVGWARRSSALRRSVARRSSQRTRVAPIVRRSPTGLAGTASRVPYGDRPRSGPPASGGSASASVRRTVTARGQPRGWRSSAGRPPVLR